MNNAEPSIVLLFGFSWYNIDYSARNFLFVFIF